MNKEKIKASVKYMLGFKRLWILLLLPASGILIFTAKSSTDFAEWYAENIYKHLSLFWNNVSGIFPFSLAEIIVIAFPFAIIVFLIYTIIMLVKRRGKRLKLLYKSILNVLCVVSVGAFLFTTNCGINYYRYTFSELNGMETELYSADDLYEVCILLAEKASAARENTNEADGIMCLDTSDISTAQKAVNSMNKLSQSYDYINSGYSTVKSVMLSRLMSYTKITGVYFPFTFEANVNVDISDYSVPLTMCHELSHLSGFMREDEANFIAFLACINSDYDDFVYSGYITAFVYAANQLYSADVERYAEAYSYLSEGVISDLSANSEYWSQFETPVAEAASSINDSYLKSNSQDDGVKSYGRMVDLIIAYYK